MKHSSQSKRRGFTLIEMLVVMAIIAILAAIGFGTFFSIQESSKIKETKARFDTIQGVLDAQAANLTEDHRATLGIPDGASYPIGNGGKNSSAALVKFLSGDINGNGDIDDGETMGLAKMLDQKDGPASFVKNGLLVDAWGQEVYYTYNEYDGEYSGDKNNIEGSIDLRSPGPDGKYDTEDDITNF